MAFPYAGGAYPPGGYRPGYPPALGVGVGGVGGGMGMGVGMGVGMGAGVGVGGMGMGGMGMGGIGGMGVGAMGGMGGMGVGAMGGMGGYMTVFQVPTTFQIRRNFFSMGGEMDIYTNGQPYFRCIAVPNPIGFGYNFMITDMLGNQLCYIQHDLSLGMPHFHIYLRGMLYGTIKQDWTGMNKLFELRNLMTGEFVLVAGDYMAWNFTFQERGMQVGQALGYPGSENYDVVVAPGVDSLFILAATLTIDKLTHEFNMGNAWPGMGGMGGMGGVGMGVGMGVW